RRSSRRSSIPRPGRSSRSASSSSRVRASAASAPTSPVASSRPTAIPSRASTRWVRRRASAAAASPALARSRAPSATVACSRRAWRGAPSGAPDGAPAPGGAMAALVKIGAKKTGAWLVRHALEQLPISHTFGIPGVHNTEIYDELAKSESIDPVLVTHEGGASFIADAISRTGGGRIGCLVIVPAAGVTHAMSGIGEAFLDGIPMLIISGGIRGDGEFGYQLHELDQVELLRGVTKGAYRVKRHEDVVPIIYEAYHRAVTGVPGPTFVEIPYDVALFQKKIDAVPAFVPPELPTFHDDALIEEAARLLAKA